MRKIVASVLGMAVAVALSTSGTWGQPVDNNTKSSNALKAAFATVVASAAESTVQVKSDNVSMALGTIIDARGYIVTKASEVMGGGARVPRLSVRLRNEREFPATVVLTRQDLDLVCLKIDAADLKAITFADAPKIDVGEWVAAPGMPDKPVVSVGIVSTPRRKIIAKSGMLGVKLDDPSAPGASTEPAPEKGVRIKEVVPDSAAAHAGLKAEDVIVKINGKEPADTTELRSIIRSYEPNADVALTVLRNGKELEMKATLGSDETFDPASLPQRTAETILAGTVSKRSTNFPAVIQHDTVLRPSDCGGPLVDLAGNVLGVNIARAGRTESYAIPGDLIKPILLKLDATTQPSTQPTMKVSAPAKR